MNSIVDDLLGTNGGMLAPVDGKVHGGQILAVNVEALGKHRAEV